MCVRRGSKLDLVDLVPAWDHVRQYIVLNLVDATNVYRYCLNFGPKILSCSCSSLLLICLVYIQKSKGLFPIANCVGPYSEP